MKIKPVLLLGTAAVMSFTGPNLACAGPVTATLSAQYFQLSEHDPDVSHFSTPNVALGSGLGANGLPIATMPGPGIFDVGAGNQITWWSQALNANVVPTSGCPLTVSLPFNSNMYAPCSTGTNDANVYETAIFKGNFNLSSSGSVGFNLGSDDDSFIYVDGMLIGQNPGVHGVTTVDFTSGVLSSGTHSIEVFYADRDQTGAFLSLSLDSNSGNVVITPPGSVPEPASLTIFGLGLAALLLRRRQS